MATYKFNSETGELECVSTRNGKLRSSVYMPKDSIHSGHFFENLNCHVKSKEHKRQVMKQMNVVEAG